MIPLALIHKSSDNKNQDSMFLRNEQQLGSSLSLMTANESVAQFENVGSTIWLPEYADDIFKTLKEDELKRYRVQFQSKQKQHRPQLLQLLRTVTEKHKLNSCTLHLDIYTIRFDKLNLTALVCLRIAAQLEETKVPQYHDLNRHVRFVYHPRDFKQVEGRVLVSLEFCLLRPTTAHFVQHLSRSITTLPDYYFHKASVYGIENGSFDSYEQMLNKQIKFLYELSDLTLNCHKLCNEKPSIIAASCIAFTRIQTGFQPCWTPHLESETGYREDILKPYIEIIRNLYKAHMQEQQLIRAGQLPNVSNIPKPDCNLSPTLWNSSDSGYDDVNITAVKVACNDSNNNRAGKRNHSDMMKDSETKQSDTHATSTSTNNVVMPSKRLKM